MKFLREQDVVKSLDAEFENVCIPIRCGALVATERLLKLKV